MNSLLYNEKLTYSVAIDNEEVFATDDLDLLIGFLKTSIPDTLSHYIHDDILYLPYRVNIKSEDFDIPTYVSIYWNKEGFEEHGDSRFRNRSGFSRLNVKRKTVDKIESEILDILHSYSE